MAAQEHEYEHEREHDLEHRMVREVRGLLCEEQNVRVRVGMVLKPDGGDISRFLHHKAWHVGQKEGFVFLPVPSPQGQHDGHLGLRDGGTRCTLGGAVPAY